LIPCSGTCGKSSPMASTSRDNDLSSWATFYPSVTADGELAFGEFSFTQGGTYKACYCDTTLMSSLFPSRHDNICSDPSAFNIELGKVHVSGISCLLEQGYRQGSCSASSDDKSLICTP